MTQRTCVQCDAEFTVSDTRKRGRPRAKCFDCSPAQARTQPLRVECECETCGQSFIRGQRAKFCSQRCKEDSRRVPCSECGRPSGYTKYSGVNPSGVRCNPCRRTKPVHGTGVTYKRYKCRCDECRSWATEDAKRYRANRRADGRPYKRKKKWAGKLQTCEQCGEEFRNEATRRFCSIACNGLSRRRVRSRELVHVGPAIPKDAPPTPVTVVTLPKWWGVIIQGPCGWCGEAFTATSGSARYCSDRCSKSAGLARRGKFKIAPRIRRAIYERDNFTCQLCMEPVDIDADPWSDWYPSLDHVIPQSHVLIPDHSLANLRTAHRWCNAVRGDGTWHADFFEGVA